MDVTDVPAVEIGNEAVLLGTQEEHTITVEEVARWSGTIPYEVFTSISRRVPRFYQPLPEPFVDRVDSERAEHGEVGSGFRG